MTDQTKHDVAKPRVEIHRWTLFDGQLVGEAINHPRLGRDFIRSSHILNVDMDALTVETRNTIYVLMGEGDDWRTGKVRTQQGAFNAVKRQLHNDPDMAWAWLCNIAMPIYDTPQPSLDHANKHRFANEAAARVLRLIFDLDITKHPHWQGFVDGWAILDASANTLLAPEAGQVWRHRSGNDYTVLGVTSVPDGEKADKFPRSVFYRGPDNRTWVRGLASWLESFTLVPQMADVPECNGSHDDGQIAAGDAACTACAGEQSA